MSDPTSEPGANGSRPGAPPVLPYADPHAAMWRTSSASLAFPVAAYAVGAALYLISILGLPPAALGPLWCVGVLFLPFVAVVPGSVVLVTALTLTRLFGGGTTAEPSARAYGWTGVAYAVSVAIGWWLLHATNLAPISTLFESGLHWIPIVTLPAVAPLWLLRRSGS